MIVCLDQLHICRHQLGLHTWDSVEVDLEVRAVRAVVVQQGEGVGRRGVREDIWQSSYTRHVCPSQGPGIKTSKVAPGLSERGTLASWGKRQGFKQWGWEQPRRLRGLAASVVAT